MSLTSKKQNVKRDADRELLQRYIDGLTYKIRMTNRIYSHTFGTPLAGKRFFKKYVICDEMLITLNMFTSELLNGQTNDLGKSRKDFDIINSYLQYPIITSRLFTSQDEAKRMIGHYLDRNIQLLRAEGL
jgi:hypothetical protein